MTPEDRASKPTIPEVLDRFRAYYNRPGNGAWGSLHAVLDDFNLEDYSVRGCLEWAEQQGDAEGAELARLLLAMSRTQRRRISHLCDIRARETTP